MNYIDIIGLFLFYYPVIMSIVWMVGGIVFFIRRECNHSRCPNISEYPLVSVLIPARNEEQDITDTVEAIFNLAYPNYEVIVINDASTDNTLQILTDLQQKYTQLKVLNLQQNLGKANALNYAVPLCSGEFIFTIDADSMLDEWAIHWAIWHFRFPRVGAVTGNPRVRNRTSLLAKIQTAEYASVIGLIKRTQRLLGKVMTVSGVVAAWRKQALLECGMWSTDMITDDIDLTWKMETHFWDVRYEPNMLCWMLVPETLKGLWRQRKRWSQGGVEVIRRYRGVMLSWKARRIWGLYIEYVAGVVWSYCFILAVGVYLVNIITGTNFGYGVLGDPFARWNGALITLVCLLQFLVSLILDYRYDKKIYKIYFWVIWYPVVYWFFNALTVIVATPKALFKQMGKPAIWVSPDRGIRGGNNG